MISVGLSLLMGGLALRPLWGLTRSDRWGLWLGAVALLGGFVRVPMAVRHYTDNCILRHFYSDLERPDPDPIRVYGKVLGFPRRFPEGWQMTLRVQRVEYRQEAFACPGHITLWIPTGPETSPGSEKPPSPWFHGTRVEALGYWSPLLTYRNAGTYRPMAVMARGLHGRLRLKQPTLIWVERPGPAVFRWLHARRERLQTALAQVEARPASRARPLLQSLWLGDRGEMDPTLDRALRRTGLYHILSISGLHVGLLAGTLAFFFLRVLALPRRWAYGLMTVVLVGYGILVGLDAPVLRSVALVGLYLVGRSWFLPVHPMNLLAGLWCVLLLWRPLWLWDWGFQMTFGITGGLLMSIGSLLAGVTGRGRVFVGTLLTAWVAPLWSAPWTVGVFGWWTWTAVLWNLIAGPVVGALVALGLGMSLGVGLPGSQAVLTGLIRVLEPMLDAFVRTAFHPWNGHAVLPSATGFVGISLLVLTVASMSRVLGLSGWRSALRWTLWIISLPLAYGIGRLPEVFKPPVQAGTVEVVLLDVGQGEAILVRDAERVVLLDGGGRPGSRWDIGTYVVVPALQALGVRHVDALVLSHPHPDHYVGLRAVLEHFGPTRFYYPVGTEVPVWIRSSPVWPRVEAIPLAESMDFSIGPLTWRVLHPPPDYQPPSVNEASLVLTVTYGGVRILLTGDIEKAAEGRLVRDYGPDLQATVLKVAHHGSQTSTTPAFLEAVRPRWALCSAGARNRFGFPHPEVVRRLQDADVRVLCTSETGQVRLLVLPSGQVTAETFRERPSRDGSWGYTESENRPEIP
ncbi:MAG: DNA internalization-related competence protein ComEC/Rec2 [Acidobacteria bacterium]|nr:DNA internalization-related competence protein ComEC/Rec2 [Acidobacteriota bacterium]MDW7983603.1 DNA internalization-related competence protein ComEC/Rec2 [Acidobacteriota bacterium]